MSESKFKNEVSGDSSDEESPDHTLSQSHSEKGTHVNTQTLMKDIGHNPDHKEQMVGAS